MKNKIHYILLFIAVSFTSCEQDTVGGLVLDEVVFHENADQVGKYLYHSNGLVKRYEFRFDGKLEEYSDYLYSGSKVTARKIYQLTSGGSFKLVRTDTYAYDASGRIEEVTADEDGSLETVYTFTWQDGKITRIDYRSAWTGSLHKNYYELAYDPAGNVSMVSSFNIDDMLPVLNFVVEYEYDDNVNPLLGLTEPSDYLARNPNNIRKITQRPSPEAEPYSITNVTYVYNESGLPQEKVEATDSNGGSSVTIKFFYKRM